MPRILITGATGLLGHHLAENLIDVGEVVQAARPGTVSRAGVAVDINDHGSVANALLRVRPEVVIHAAGISSPAACEADPAAAFRTNVAGSAHVAEACRRIGARLVFVSTDWVFDGEALAGYREDDTPHPRQVYGRTKLLAETSARTIPGSLIVRLSLLYELKASDRPPRFPATELQKLSEGKVVVADGIEERQPMAARDAARIVTLLIERDVAGIVHIAPHQVITKYRWLQLLGQACGLQPELVHADTASHSYHRPRRPTLLTGRLTQLGIQLPRDASVIAAEASPGRTVQHSTPKEVM